MAGGRKPLLGFAVKPRVAASGLDDLVAGVMLGVLRGLHFVGHIPPPGRLGSCDAELPGQQRNRVCVAGMHATGDDGSCPVTKDLPHGHAIDLR